MRINILIKESRIPIDRTVIDFNETSKQLTVCFGFKLIKYAANVTIWNETPPHSMLDFEYI